MARECKILPNLCCRLSLKRSFVAALEVHQVAIGVEASRHFTSFIHSVSATFHKENEVIRRPKFPYLLYVLSLVSEAYFFS